MPAVHLVRHGQASFGVGDYDRLSDLGHEQAVAVGVALRVRGVVPSAIVHGSLRRQRESAERIAEAWGTDAPTLREDPRWDEYDHRTLLIRLRARYRSNAVLMAELAKGLHPAQAFHAVLEEALERWTGGAFDDEYEESFAAFGARADAAFAAALAPGAPPGEGPVLAVGSAGTIGAVAANVLGLDPAGWRMLNRVAVNTGVTTIVAGRRGRSLVSFNEHAHLGGAGRPARTTR